MLSGTRRVSGPDVWCDEHFEDFTLALTLLHWEKYHNAIKHREIPACDGKEDMCLFIWNISKPGGGMYLGCKETVRRILLNY